MAAITVGVWKILQSQIVNVSKLMGTALFIATRPSFEKKPTKALMES